MGEKPVNKLMKAFFDGFLDSFENRSLGYDSLQVPNERRWMAMVADELSSRLQKFKAGLCHQHSQTLNVSNFFLPL